MKLFISRKQHDWLMENAKEVFDKLFSGKKKNRRWSLAGLHIEDASESLLVDVQLALHKMGQ